MQLRAHVNNVIGKKGCKVLQLLSMLLFHYHAAKSSGRACAEVIMPTTKNSKNSAKIRVKMLSGVCNAKKRHCTNQETT